jgi:hypothetical protein
MTLKIEDSENEVISHHIMEQKNRMNVANGEHMADSQGISNRKRCMMIDVKRASELMTWAQSNNCELANYKFTEREPLYFHTFWAYGYSDVVPNLIKSFLLSQDLSFSKLIVWSNVTLTDDRITYFAKYFPKYVEFRIFNLNEYTNGTCLHGMPKFYKYIAHGLGVYSDAVRILLLHRHGGFWIDADSLLMKDVTPLIHVAHEFASGNKHYNTAAFHLRKGSGTSEKYLQGVCHMLQKGIPKKYSPRAPNWLFNDSGPAYCIGELNCQITGIHRRLTDPEWHEDLIPCRHKEITQIPNRIKDTFILHTRGDNCILPKDNYHNKIIEILDLALEERAKSEHLLSKAYAWLENFDQLNI